MSDREVARELFRHTVDVADVDPPNMEFRVLRQIVWQEKPDVIYTTASKPEALHTLERVAQYHAETYAEYRVWMEQRSVSEWRESE